MYTYPCFLNRFFCSAVHASFDVRRRKNIDFQFQGLHASYLGMEQSSRGLEAVRNWVEGSSGWNFEDLQRHVELGGGSHGWKHIDRELITSMVFQTQNIKSIDSSLSDPFLSFKSKRDHHRLERQTYSDEETHVEHVE